MRIRKWLRNGLLATLALVAATAIFAVWLSPNYFDLIVFRPSTWKAPPPAEIPVSDALADLAVLERILRTGYVGYDYFQQRGTDWGALFGRAKAEVADHSAPIPFCDFAATVNDLLQSVDDEHLGVWPGTGNNTPDCHLPRRGVIPLASDAWFRLAGDAAVVDEPALPGVLVGSRLLDCAGRDVRRDLHYAARKVGERWQFGRRIVYLSKRKSREEITCRFRAPDGKIATATVAMDLMMDYEKYPPWWRKDSRAKAIEVAPGEITYLRLGTFRPENESDMSPFLKSAVSAAAARAIVIDLRANFGGTNDYFNQWSHDLLGGSKDMGDTVRLTSETTSQAEINSITRFWAFSSKLAARRPSLTVEAVEEFAGLVWRGVVRRGAAWRRVDRYRWKFAGRADRPFAGHMLLVVDHGCASACEGAIELARVAFDALVVGTNTVGMHAFPGPLPYRLPKSRLELRVARRMEASLLDGDEFRESRGFMPDVWIDLRDDGAAARELGSCLADPACAAEILPSIKAADERHRDISTY
jgi:hypothetical protein